MSVLYKFRYILLRKLLLGNLSDGKITCLRVFPVSAAGVAVRHDFYGLSADRTGNAFQHVRHIAGKIKLDGRYAVLILFIDKGCGKLLL